MRGRRCTGGLCLAGRALMLSSAPLAERSHSGLVRRVAKPLKGVSSSEGSNPSLSATIVAHVPVAQWIERQVADLKVGGSSPLGHAIASPARTLPLRETPSVSICEALTPQTFGETQARQIPAHRIRNPCWRLPGQLQQRRLIGFGWRSVTVGRRSFAIRGG